MADSYQQSTLSGFEETEPKKTPRKRKSRIDEMLLGVPKDELKRVSLAGAEIVRRQYLSHIKEAMVTIRPDGVIFNNSCIAKMLDTYYIHFFIDRKQKLMIIRACEENDKDGQRWCNEKDGVRKSKKITGRPFCARLYRMMGWSRGYYYKVCGTPALQEDDDDELLFVFELNDYECYGLTAKGRKAAGVSDDELDAEELRQLNEEEQASWEQARAEGRKAPKPMKRERLPESWGEDSFGPKYPEHSSRVVIPRVNDLETFTAEEFNGQRTQK